MVASTFSYFIGIQFTILKFNETYFLDKQHVQLISGIS